jgi:hypothetical protein
MTKQTKRDKKAKAGKEQAEAIIEQAVEAVASKAEAVEYGDRPETCTEAEWATACAVRGLREQGEAWWAIAQTLGLPGAGSSAATGKAGASQARKAYAKGFGAHPRSFTRGQGRTRREKNETVRTLSQTTKRAKVEKVRSGTGGVIDPNIDSAELAEMLKGRKVQWMIIGDAAPDGLEQEAWVHPTAPIYIEGEGADRQIEFREQHKRAPQEVRWMPAHIRTVRLSRIFNVKGVS